MKKQIVTILVTMFMSSIVFIPAAMGDSCCPSEKGTQIDQTSKVDDYQLEYQFIDMKEKMKNIPDMDNQMGGMSATHHLMVYIKNAQGETVTADKVGYMITGPDGKEQKVMTMGMGGGYGADVNLSLPGEYTVKTKAVIGEQKLIDSFTYTIK